MVTVKLDAGNRLMEITQEIHNNLITIKGDKVELYTNGSTTQYPNSLEGLRDVYMQCGLLVEFINSPLCIRIKAIDSTYKKELIYDKTNHNFISILECEDIKVMLSTGETGWSCTTIIDNDVKTVRGNSLEMHSCLYEYASNLQKAFPAMQW
ncbi:hypothetical protein TSMG0010 [Halocynthia phage JM-2012]|uniref:hypothetical protein n=1 Tax=Halocynthia phage JM-2012 TaxID=1173297 RepID=UPI00025C68D9|nr:hypothetical protein TSMG0010 [Halocynthia phage JM-2012]AFI55293.1 hypothetical protein TSMG0010 [Halocynthia phage JM-2012]